MIERIYNGIYADRETKRFFFDRTVYAGAHGLRPSDPTLPGLIRTLKAFAADVGWELVDVCESLNLAAQVGEGVGHDA